MTFGPCELTFAPLLVTPDRANARAQGPNVTPHAPNVNAQALHDPAQAPNCTAYASAPCVRELLFVQVVKHRLAVPGPPLDEFLAGGEAFFGEAAHEDRRSRVHAGRGIEEEVEPLVRGFRA